MIGTATAGLARALVDAPVRIGAAPAQFGAGSVRNGIVAALVLVGSAFLVAGTVGLLRFDTVYNRMHAVTKPTSIGVVAVFLAAFVHFGPGGAGLPSLVGIAFLFLTIPTGTHMIARSAERMGVPFREGVTWPEPPGGDATGTPEGGDGALEGGERAPEGREGAPEGGERAPEGAGDDAGAGEDADDERT